MLRYIFLLLPILLTSCYSIETNTVYNRSLTKSNSESDRIYLTFSNTKGSSFDFLLAVSNDKGEKSDILKVRWANPNGYVSQFNGMQSTIKFLIDEEEIIVLHPIKDPVFISYSLETGLTEEEILFKISRKDLERLAYAKTVKVELAGRDRIVNAKFNKWHTFRAFKNFVANS